MGGEFNWLVWLCFKSCFSFFQKLRNDRNCFGKYIFKILFTHIYMHTMVIKLTIRSQRSKLMSYLFSYFFSIVTSLVLSSRHSSMLLHKWLLELYLLKIKLKKKDSDVVAHYLPTGSGWHVWCQQKKNINIWYNYE